MIIKSITLENIRSYTKETINFDNGIVVLSGDIGAGKSTILLALEFALFGNLESGLLRHGVSDGSVEIILNVNNQDVTIKRFLKRKSEGIRQQSGYIVVNNTKKDLTPVELKEHISMLLGYPKESASKRSLVYRYSTYTPQDEMKVIMYEDSEERINTIRKIFNIDKYQRIIENATVFARFLREQKRELLGKIADLEQKKSSVLQIQEEKSTLMKNEKELEVKMIEAKKSVEKAKMNLTQIEQEIRKLHELKKEKALLESNIKYREEQRLHLEKEIRAVEEDLQKQKISPDAVESIRQKIKTAIKEEIAIQEKELSQLQRQIGELEANKKASEKTKKQVIELKDCPLCLQEVPHTHKEKIVNTEQEKIQQAEQQLAMIQEQLKKIQMLISQKNGELQESIRAEKELSALHLQMRQSQEKESALKEKRTSFDMVTQEAKRLQEKLQAMQIPSSEEKEMKYLSLKRELDNALSNERGIELEKVKISTTIKNKEQLEAMMKKEINEKERAKVKLTEASLLEQWIQNNFSKIISMMEKHVLSTTYFTFNDIFKALFEILIDDERMIARIDETFTPIIEQNGHETEFSFLSGGEKTSVCLAYRLALYKALQSMRMQPTALILDEPTDGFSSEQIDRMRDVFDKVQAAQTIIVSHENKLESIADHVIRIIKEGHQSKAVL